MKWYLIIIPLFLTACLEKEKPKTACFDIINLPNAPSALQPILVNKCTGETWIALLTPMPKRADQLTPDKVYHWHKVDQSPYSNSVAGVEKAKPAF